MILQTALRQQKNNYEEFLESKKINFKEYDDGRLLVKYGIGANLSDPLVQQARGTIFDIRDNFRLIAWPFSKFFNHFESQASSIDWASAHAYEKFDGTCICAYWYDNQLRVSTLGMADAEGQVHASENLTFNSLAMPLVRKHINSMDPQFCYTFELCTPFNRIVTPYDKVHFKLIGIRHLQPPYPEVYPYFGLKKQGFSVPDRHKINSLDEVLKKVESLQGLEEGFVVVDKYFNRIKIKSERYWRAFKVKNTTNEHSIAKMALLKEGAEFLHCFPEYTPQYDKWCNKIEKILNKVDHFILAHKHLDRPEFAKQAVKLLPRISWLAFEKLDNPDIPLEEIILARMEKNVRTTCRYLEMAYEHLKK